MHAIRPSRLASTLLFEGLEHDGFVSVLIVVYYSFMIPDEGRQCLHHML